MGSPIRSAPQPYSMHTSEGSSPSSRTVSATKSASRRAPSGSWSTTLSVPCRFPAAMDAVTCSTYSSL